MQIIEKEIIVKDYLTKSNLPASDYVINPYVGCPHACKYCYATFMKRFTGHDEKWGTFIDIKKCNKPINTKKLQGKSVFISSVTDCYNPFEEKYRITRKILKQLVDANCKITISTKSNLILQDLDLLQKMPNLQVAISINTLNESFQKDMDHACSISERLATLNTLHTNGIYTVLFMSPIFPYLTEYQKIIDSTRNFVSEYWFENLNLRGEYRCVILDYIRTNYPNLLEEYHKIYIHKDMTYWMQTEKELAKYCHNTGVKYVNYFYHEKLIDTKK